MEVQLSLWGVNRPIEESTGQTLSRSKKEIFEDYDGFVDKFNRKHTTDDCYTPAEVYDAVLEFIGTLINISDHTVVRPFYPGGDFVSFEYPSNALVVDNPPFSILTKIIRFYTAQNILFFLFAPSLTLFLARDCDLTYIVSDSHIMYENGAVVRTGFITNIPSDVRIWCCPKLKKALAAAQKKQSKKKKQFIYPNHIITAATLQKIAARGVELKINKRSCEAISDSDSAKAMGRGLYGGGYILSDSAAAERAAAERAAAERAAAERAAAERAAADTLQLSPREKMIVKRLNEQEQVGDNQ